MSDYDETAKLFVPAGHYYSPIPEPAVAGNYADWLRDIYKPGVDVPGINIDSERMRTFWTEKLAPHAADLTFPDSKQDGKQYYYENDFFSYGDAATYSLMIRHLRPNKVVEVGSGFSSACLLDTLAESGQSPELVFIEPYADRLRQVIGSELQSKTTLMEHSVQSVDMAVFEALESGDLLFIDSTHAFKGGSDVTHELLEILPRLKPGVIVHFHDIFYPFEYPREWIRGDQRAWNECHAMRAFLMYNSRFEIVFFNDYFAQVGRDLLEADCPVILRNAGAGLYLRVTGI